MAEIESIAVPSVKEIQKIRDRRPRTQEEQRKAGNKRNLPEEPLEPHKGGNVDVKV